jgi:hypothetical protein
VRCKRSNSCPYCAWMASVENTLVVAHDARWRQPSVGMTLTTDSPDFTMDRFRWATAKLFRWLRTRDGCARADGGGRVEYLGLMEWTTGERTPGRRPHMHALVKGLDPDATDELHPQVREKWSKLTGGSWVVECRPLRTPGGAIAYMVGHHHKREQAPPAGWSGKRIRPSQGYFERPVAELRRHAKRTILDALWWAEMDAPAPSLCRVRDVDGQVVDVVTGEVLADAA